MNNDNERKVKKMRNDEYSNDGTDNACVDTGTQFQWTTTTTSAGGPTVEMAVNAAIEVVQTADHNITTWVKANSLLKALFEWATVEVVIMDDEEKGNG